LLYSATMHELTLAVVGIDFPNADKSGSSRRMELMMCRPGDPVGLRPEPRNKHDGYAVGVWSERGVQLGYLTAERAPMVSKRLADGVEVEAIYQGLEGSAGYVRARFGGGSPTLPGSALVEGTPSPAPRRSPPGPRPAMIDVDGFYPDPDGPEFGA
jgi:hypothetical protein